MKTRQTRKKEALVALNVQIPESQKAELDRIAGYECTSGAAIVRRALRLFLAANSTNVEPAGKAAQA